MADNYMRHNRQTTDILLQLKCYKLHVSSLFVFSSGNPHQSYAQNIDFIVKKLF